MISINYNIMTHRVQVRVFCWFLSKIGITSKLFPGNFDNVTWVARKA